MGDSWNDTKGDKFTRGARKNHKARKHEFENDDDDEDDYRPNRRQERESNEEDSKTA